MSELRFVVLLCRKESASLGFSVIIDARKPTTKRKHLGEIVEAMVGFQVRIIRNHFPKYTAVNGTRYFVILVHTALLTGA